jgi:type II secretory pathway predicted ATPase ExeA
MSTPTIPHHHKRRLQAHFGLNRLPFRKNMPANLMFDSTSQRELHQGMGMWTEIKGLALVTGPSGVGKSIALRRFVHHLDDGRFRVLQSSSLPTTQTGFLRSLCRLLGLGMRLHRADMFDAAQKHLFHYQEENGVHPILILDDAEGLHIETLDLLRRLSAFDLDAEDRFSILLAATEELLAVLRSPMLESLRTRIGYVQTLRPFSLEDTRNYVRFHLDGAGAPKGLFTDKATTKLFHASLGKPRRINQLALQAMIQAAVYGRDDIDGEFLASQIAAHPLYQSRVEDKA